MYTMPPLTPVCRHLLMLNVIFYFGAYVVLGPESVMNDGYNSLGRMQLAAFMPHSVFFQPYQIFTHLFMHYDLEHLFFNMLMLYFFGGVVELYMGPKRFLTYYFLCGLGAYLLFTGIEYYKITRTGLDISHYIKSLMGASGAIFGLYAAYGILFAEHYLYLLFPPMPVKGKHLILVILLLELYRGLSNQNSSIAHFAHLGGALAGMIMLMYWYGNRLKR